MSLLNLEINEPGKRILFVCGSPRRGGNTEVLLQEAQDAAEAAGARINRFYVSDGEVSPCVSCEGCFQTGECVIDDRMGEFLDLADAADVLLLGTPVYWSGPPAQLKAVIDRFQPRWARRYLLNEPARAPKRPAHVLVTRTGNDPHGFEPLVTIARSGLAILDFALIDVHDFVEGFDNGNPGAIVSEDHRRAARDLGAQLALSEV